MPLNARCAVCRRSNRRHPPGAKGSNKLDVDPRDRRYLSEINVVPLVDVVLVLLIIFMITAPLLYRGIDIALPVSATNTIQPTERLGGVYG